ncbi:MAG: T9SS type A sorting domain-containing protein, partial [Bacteroidetes bacterium]|nr:T9SS type A sorting domain-containing protein [Bacteroidota bacterium]
EDTVDNLDLSYSMYIDRSGINVAGGALFNRPTAAQSAWVLDDVIPQSAIEKTDLTVEEIQEMSEEYLFLCSGSYVWICNGAFGDGLQVKWNRLSNRLVDGATEFLTAIAVSGDNNHTLYVGSSKGKLWRLDRAHDIANFDAIASVVRLDNQPNSNLAIMAGRGITDIAVDPKNPERVVVTFGSYGGSVQNAQTMVWITNGALSSPVFGRLTGSGIKAEPAYVAEFVEDPNSSESVLLLGTESGLLSVRDINNAIPQLYTSTVTNESGSDFGGVPVYDIFVRKYKSIVTEDALTRKEIRINPIPGGGFDTTEVEIARASHELIKDNTVFVASHGLGVWSTSSVLLGRQGNTEEPVKIEQSSISLYPNPTQSETNIKFELTAKSIVSIVMYTVDGKTLSVTNKTFQAGVQEVNYDMNRLAPGMYFFRVDVQGENETISKTLKSVVVR